MKQLFCLRSARKISSAPHQCPLRDGAHILIKKKNTNDLSNLTFIYQKVTDFAFSPHDDGVIASGSQDGTVKVSPLLSSSILVIIILGYFHNRHNHNYVAGVPCALRPIQWKPDGEKHGHTSCLAARASSQDWDGDHDPPTLIRGFLSGNAT